MRRCVFGGCALGLRSEIGIVLGCAHVEGGVSQQAEVIHGDAQIGRTASRQRVARQVIIRGRVARDAENKTGVPGAIAGAACDDGRQHLPQVVLERQAAPGDRNELVILLPHNIVGNHIACLGRFVDHGEGSVHRIVEGIIGNGGIFQAAAFWAVSVPVMEEIGHASGDLEGAFWVLNGILLFQRARRTRRVMDWILAGLVMGLAALSRSVLLAGALLLVISILLEESSATMRTRFKWAVAYGLALCLVLAPWVVRNQIVFGVPSLGSSLTGYNLFRQNYYAGSLQVPPHFVGSKEGEPVVKALVQSAPPPAWSNELRMESFYTRAALRDILGHPFRYVELSAFRFVSLWFNSTVKAAYGERTDKLDIAQLIQQIFFLCAALVGGWKHRRWLWPMSLAVVGVTMAYILVIGQIRYLVEVMPLLAILGASSFLPASTQQEHQALALEVR